jgi:solute carrier family 24 (sodium/potassium/calcium exchanger), member 6
MRSAGNSAGDFVANSAMAKSARVTTAMTAVYAGPLLDVLVAVPLGFWVLLTRFPQEGVPDAELTPVLTATGAMLLLHNISTLLIAKANNGFLPRCFNRVAASVYTLYLVIVVVLVAFGQS